MGHRHERRAVRAAEHTAGQGHLPIVTILVTAAITVGLPSLSPEPASAHGLCKNIYGGDVIYAHDLSCRKARRIVRTWGIRYSEDEIVNRRVLGYRCRGKNDAYEGLTVRCSRGSRWVRFYANAP